MISKDAKRIFVVCVGFMYFISFWLLTIGYFTPHWLRRTHGSDDILSGWNDPIISCPNIALFGKTRTCDKEIINWINDNNKHNIAHVLHYAFILMTSSVVVVYTNAAMLCSAIVFDLMPNLIFNSLLSISFGVLYPIAAILILVATIYVEVEFGSSTGYSTYLCTAAGGLIFIVYFSLIIYDWIYTRQSSRPKGMVTKLKSIAHAHVHDVKESRHRTGVKQINLLDNRMLHSENDVTAFVSKNKPVRNWGLRRI